MMKKSIRNTTLLKQSFKVALKFFRRLHLFLPKIKYTTEGTAATLRKRQPYKMISEAAIHYLHKFTHKVLCTNKEFFLVFLRSSTRLSVVKHQEIKQVKLRGHPFFMSTVN